MRILLSLQVSGPQPRSDGQPSPALRGIEGVFHRRRPARDLSGIVCKPALEGAAQRFCLVVNDRDPLCADRDSHERRITPGPTVRDPRRRPSEAAAGRRGPARDGRSAGDGFSDLDGEAETYASLLFLGSHTWLFTQPGVSLPASLRPAVWIDAGPRVAGQGRVLRSQVLPVDALRLTETTYRLSEACGWSSRSARKSVDLELNGQPGGPRDPRGRCCLYAGLRAPSLDGYAYIVRTDVQPRAFTPDTPLEPRTIPLARPGCRHP